MIEQRLETAANMRPTNHSTDNTFSKFNNTACRTNKSRFSSSQTVSYIPVLILLHISYSLFHVWVLLPKCYQARSRSREECPCTFVTSVRLFAYISASPSGRICVTVVIEDFYLKKKLSESKFCWKSHKKYRALYIRTKDVSLLPAISSLHKSALFDWIYIRQLG